MINEMMIQIFCDVLEETGQSIEMSGEGFVGKIQKMYCHRELEVDDATDAKDKAAMSGSRDGKQRYKGLPNDMSNELIS